jgi:hypothetical protein
MEKITQIVVIDPTVEDYQSLAPSAEPRKEIFILDRAGDGVEQITELLASYTIWTLFTLFLTAGLEICNWGQFS